MKRCFLTWWDLLEKILSSIGAIAVCIIACITYRIQLKLTPYGGERCRPSRGLLQVITGHHKS
ncbi:MAG: hypothetical protein F6K09_06345 [Merismopedia sp. SIO2A8]|nr:hypothetical protein [Merismopedia sp. SIO2A8]